MSFFAELKRRNVFRVAIAYLVGAWVLLQIVDFALDAITAPNWILQVFILAAAIGLPVALIFAWVFELTPEGIRRESQVDRSHSITPSTGRKLDRVIIAFMALAILILVADRLWLRDAGKGLEKGSEPISRAEPERIIGPSATEEGSKKGSDPIKSIAVLPFVNMSSDPEQEYFSDGITEEILNRLASVRGLHVAARTSAFSFKGHNQDVREIAQLLGVGNILEGSVRKASGEVRITAQLIRASDGFHLWSESYDRKLENIFAIQEDIAGQIAGALEISLGMSAQPSGQSARQVNPEVYDLYLRARALHRQRGEGELEAIELFQQALAIDPEFAPAWAGLSHSYQVVPNYVSDHDWHQLGDVLELGMTAAEKALDLDPNLPTALHAMGNNLQFRYEWAKAEEFYLRALELDPDSADIMEDYVNMLTLAGRLGEAGRIAKRMLELDPRVPIFLLDMIYIDHANGDFALRDQNIRLALDINPDLPNTQAQNLIRLLQYDQFDEARAYAAVMSPTSASQEDVRELVDWVAKPEADPGPSVLRALDNLTPTPALLAGRYDIWLSVLQKWAGVWPEWELQGLADLLAPIASPEQMHEYRADPRTKDYLTRLRLPEYWRKVGWPEYCQPVGEDDFECY